MIFLGDLWVKLGEIMIFVGLGQNSLKKHLLKYLLLCSAKDRKYYWFEGE